jgi:predicted ATP-binding protein involved in virulence
MRITEISVEGLFGTFNHIIPLNQEDRITILHSPNGFGKTAILKLVHFMFRRSFDTTAFLLIPFQKLSFQGNNKFSIFKGNEELSIIKGEHEVIAKYTRNGNTVDSDKMNSFHQIVQSIKTLFISIERINEQRTHWLKNIIEETSDEYTKKSQILESTYPTRLVEKKKAFEISLLKEKLRSIEEKQTDLVSIGLFDARNLTNISFIEKVDDSNKIALSLYVEDMSEKLGLFDELEEKVEVLLDIINSRFVYKKMFVRKEKGIYFLDDNGVELAFNQLSSGEQHELVLFYELLFDVEENTLVLIDEPELSLHVSWQTQFLNDLIRVAKNAKFDVLLATHSPQIIADRWDLTVELKGQPLASTNGNGNNAVKN